MRVVKVPGGYSIVAGNHQKVTMIYKGHIVTQFKNIVHILDSHWHKNYRDTVVTCSAETGIKGHSFKDLKAQIKRWIGYYITYIPYEDR